jgi:hypothetical protein
MVVHLDPRERVVVVVDALNLYHSTAPQNAQAIMRYGFLDGEIALYPGGVERRGQFVSDRPLRRKPTDEVIEMDWDGTGRGACDLRVQHKSLAAAWERLPRMARARKSAESQQASDREVIDLRR